MTKNIIKYKSFVDSRGSLSPLDFSQLPFPAKRIYWITGAQAPRGGHAHKKNIQLIICLAGTIELRIRELNDTEQDYTVQLMAPNEGFLLEPFMWHTYKLRDENSVGLVFASELYDKDDYII